MDTLLIILAIICGVVGVFGSFLPVLPGPPIAYLGILLAHWSGYVAFSTDFLVLWAVITGGVTIIDYFLPAWITKKVGGSKYATRGAAIGTVLGLFFMPWGVVLGPFAGALIGEMIHDRSNNAKAFKVAFGSFLAFILGSGLKLVVSVIMVFHIIKGAFF